MFLLVEAVLSQGRIARRRPAEASGLTVSLSCRSRSAALPRCHAGGGRPAARARPFRSPANIYRAFIKRRHAPTRRQETISCFKSQAALERRLLRQRIPATGMNTECKDHHKSRAASVEILDTRCLTQAPEGNSPAGRPGGTRGEFPCWTLRQPSKCRNSGLSLGVIPRHQRGIPLLDA